MSLKYRTRFNGYNTFFITTTCYKRMHLLKRGNAYTIVIDSLNYLVKNFEISVLGYVLMPNHIHLLIYFEDADKRSDVIREFKKFTSRMIRDMYQECYPYFMTYLTYLYRDQQFKIWDDRFDEIPVDNRSSCERVLNYIHLNPLQTHWTLADRPEDYPFSSASFYELNAQSAVTLTHYRDIF